MDKKRLNEANRLIHLIEKHEKALLCFVYDKNEYINDMREAAGEEKLSPEYESTNPQLIIEFDAFDDDWIRQQVKIPMVLSDFLVEMIKAAITESLSKLEMEFNSL